MRILHTSDWHLGRSLHGYSLIEDQRYILNCLLECVQKEKIDVLIIAGDVYDKTIPSEAAVELFNYFLEKIILEYKIYTLIIAGNHDSHERIHFGSDIFKSQKLYMVGKCEMGYSQMTLHKEHEEIDVYMMPYIDPPRVREISGNEAIKRHDEGIQYLVESMRQKKRDVPNILIGHAFVTGGDVSDSERRLSVVGGAELVDVSHFKDFTYTALGHLHKKQAMGAEHIRYSGSLLKYSVSEVNQKKGVVIIDIKDKNHISIEEKDLKPLRDVRILTGKLEEIINLSLEDTQKDDYVYGRIIGEQVADATAKLRNIYPNILGTEFVSENKRDHDTEEDISSMDFLVQKERTVTEVFMEFLDYVGDSTFEEDEKAYIQKIVTGIEEAKNEA